MSKPLFATAALAIATMSAAHAAPPRLDPETGFSPGHVAVLPYPYEGLMTWIELTELEDVRCRPNERYGNFVIIFDEEAAIVDDNPSCWYVEGEEVHFTPKGSKALRLSIDAFRWKGGKRPQSMISSKNQKYFITHDI